MSHELVILVGTAAWIGMLHTLAGPDHYLPFIVISRARNWSAVKTGTVTFLCGLGHVLSSVVLGAIGIVIMELMGAMQWLEDVRGSLAAWLLIGFGLAYFAWGVRKAILNKPHTHKHLHAAGEDHSHEHVHESGHVHVHENENQEQFNITPWILFIIFVFGPCEALIPMMMFGAKVAGSPWGALPVAVVFSIATISTMFVVVLAAAYGLKLVPSKGWERYSHAMAGAAICMSGLAIQFLGL